MRLQHPQGKHSANREHHCTPRPSTLLGNESIPKEDFDQTSSERTQVRVDRPKFKRSKLGRHSTGLPSALYADTCRSLRLLHHFRGHKNVSLHRDTTSQDQRVALSPLRVSSAQITCLYDMDLVDPYSFDSVSVQDRMRVRALQPRLTSLTRPTPTAICTRS